MLFIQNANEICDDFLKFKMKQYNAEANEWKYEETSTRFSCQPFSEQHIPTLIQFWVAWKIITAKKIW